MSFALNQPCLCPICQSVFENQILSQPFDVRWGNLSVGRSRKSLEDHLSAHRLMKSTRIRQRVHGIYETQGSPMPSHTNGEAGTESKKSLPSNQPQSHHLYPSSP